MRGGRIWWRRAGRPSWRYRVRESRDPREIAEPIVTEQIDQALALDPLPTIATLNGGGNDMMRPGMDAVTLMELTEQGAAASRRRVRPVLLAGPTHRVAFRSGRCCTRGAQLTEQVGKLAVTLDVPFVNAFVDDKVRAAEYWSEDRLHLNPHGHRRVANLVLDALSVEHPDDDALSPVTYGVRSHVRFARAHFAPWLGRRLTGDRRPTGAPANTPPGPNWYPTRAEDMTEFSVASFNVNGIRAARRRGFDTWLADRAPDVVGIQELRCPETEVGSLRGMRRRWTSVRWPAATAWHH